MRTIIRPTHAQYYTLRQWTEANTERLAPLTVKEHTELANKELPFPVACPTVGDIRKELGWIKETTTAQAKKTFEALEQRITALEKVISRISNNQSFKSELL